MTLPNFAGEDCNPANGVESCTAKPCDFNPLWWHSFGGVGQHINLSSYLAGNWMTAVTYVANNGDTSSHGACFSGFNPLNKVSFSGVTLAQYLTVDPDPNLQTCQSGNIIEGKIDSDTIRADSGATGTAVSGLTTALVAPNQNGGLNGCAMGLAGGTAFVTRFNAENACQFRVAASNAVSIKDVSVGNTNGLTYVGLTVPAGQQVDLMVGGAPLQACKLASGPARSAYVMLALDVLNNVTCSKTEYTSETVQVIDYDSTGSLSIVYRAGNQFKLRQLNGTNLTAVWPTDQVDISGTAIASTLAVDATFNPSGISANGQKIAVTGSFSGTMTSYGRELISDGDLDFVLLVADSIHPQRGVTLLGKGDPNTGDLADFGTAVEWVTYYDPGTGIATEGLVVAGNTFSKDFWFESCWTDVYEYDNPTMWDSFVGVFKYTNGMDLNQQACGDHHVLTGLGYQRISSLAVGDMRLGLCGYHSNAIVLGGEIVEEFLGTEINAHCGVAVLPIQSI